MASSRKCLLCNKIYEYCPQCGHKDYDLWKITFCSLNCRSVFQTLVDYNLGAITADEAKEKLSKLDLSNKDNYNDNIKEIMNKLYPKVEEPKEETKPVQTEQPKYPIKKQDNKSKYPKMKYKNNKG